MPPASGAVPIDGLDGGEVVRGAAAPEEGAAVEVDLDAVDLDRALDGLARQRDQALLPSIADQEQVGADGVADQGAGEPAGVEEAGHGRAGGVEDRLAQPVGGKGEVGGAGEVAGHRRLRG